MHTMRTTTITAITKLAGTIGQLVTSNFVADMAMAHHYTYADYCLLVKCTGKVAISERTYVLGMAQRAQLELEGVC